MSRGYFREDGDQDTFIVVHPNDVQEAGPRFEHDCDVCQFLGRWQEFDLYYCPTGGGATRRKDGSYDSCTLISRWGEMGEYSSGAVFGQYYDEQDRDTGLRHAYLRAVERGLVEKGVYDTSGMISWGHKK